MTDECEWCGEELTKEMQEIEDEFGAEPCDCRIQKELIELKRENTDLKKRMAMIGGEL